MTRVTKAPVLFVSHGAPTFAVEPKLLGPQLNALGKSLPSVRAVLVVSPHWQTRGVKVMASASPSTIHDFGGFPAALYQLQYPAKGAPQVAQEVVDEIASLCMQIGWSVQLDQVRGLDHGAWVPLLHLLPNADVPVFQVSLPHDLNAVSAYRFGRALASMRERGVMVLTSGSMTHNLYEYSPHVDTPEQYVLEFVQWVREVVKAHAVEKIQDYRRLAPHAQRAHPTDEHFLPLVMAMGMVGDDEHAVLLDGGIEHGTLSMDSYVWGLPAQ